MAHPSIISTIAALLNTKYQNERLSGQHASWIAEVVEQIPDASERESCCAKMLQRIINDDEPIQYVLGSVPFCGLDLLIEPPILIPRPETEEWVANLISQLSTLNNTPLRILDIGTGSGCIALSLAHAAPNAEVVAVDISETALALANKNGIRNNIKNCTFLNSNLFDVITPEAPFDLIVSNPPYISIAEWHTLDQSVKEWEDARALVALDEGTKIIKEIISKAPRFLKKESPLITQNIPRLWIEIGYQQGPLIKKYMTDIGCDTPTIHKDYIGNDRIVTCS